MTGRSALAPLAAATTTIVVLVALGRASTSCAARRGDQLGAALVTWAPRAPSADPVTFAEDVTLPVRWSISARSEYAIAPLAARAGTHDRNARRRDVAPVHGLRVRADRVLALANAGARPGGVPIAASAEHPAGLRLSNVSGLGVGLEDGDVLTRASGRATLSAGAVIGAVIAERAAHSSEISGVFWRHGEPWNLIVEQPYVGERPSRAAATDAAASCRRRSCPPDRKSGR